ncbi:MAG: hypothetical protein Q8P18_20490 [Pseudomonadota bacterium]|nr:hypothetical protein [Pseudomonadota bacterium]
MDTKGVLLPCPKNFSFIENPEEVLEYFARVGSNLRRGRDVTIDLREIVNLTVDAIVLLLAHVGNKKFLRGRQISGTVPIRKEMRKFLVDSGFFDHVETGANKPWRKRSIIVGDDRGIIRTRTEKRVATDVARDVTAYGTRLAFGESRRYPAIYRTLIECMANTHNHAHPVALGDTHWWLAVGRVPGSNRVAYAFIDLGVGILRGRRFQVIMEWYNHVAAIIFPDDVDRRLGVFCDILAGKVASRTGQAYRGKGLPAIFNAHQKGEIRRLAISANEIFANFQDGEPRLLAGRHSFPGTLLYWEV